MAKHILMLASGSGKRFGENKLLFEIQGKPMVQWTMETLNRISQRREDCDLTVVSRYGEVRQIAEAMGIKAVDAPDSDKGISYTIRAGIQSIAELGEEDYLLFAVADQPELSEKSVEKLLDLADSGVLCGSMCYGETPGNPTLFSAKLVKELLELEGDKGGRQVLKRHPCVFVQAQSQGELRDIDRKSDLIK